MCGVSVRIYVGAGTCVGAGSIGTLPSCSPVYFCLKRPPIEPGARLAYGCSLQISFFMLSLSSILTHFVGHRGLFLFLIK